MFAESGIVCSGDSSNQKPSYSLNYSVFTSLCRQSYTSQRMWIFVKTYTRKIAPCIAYLYLYLKLCEYPKKLLTTRGTFLKRQVAHPTFTWGKIKKISTFCTWNPPWREKSAKKKSVSKDALCFWYKLQTISFVCKYRC